MDGRLGTFVPTYFGEEVLNQNRFDYVAYDEQAKVKQQAFKGLFKDVESHVDRFIIEGRARALVYTKLEEAYAWIGKAIRDEQILRNGEVKLQEGRGNE